MLFRSEKIRLRFESEDGRFAYLFPCDEAGNVLDGKFSAVDRLLLSWCRAGEIPSGHWQFCGPEVPGAVDIMVGKGLTALPPP